MVNKYEKPYPLCRVVLIKRLEVGGANKKLFNSY